MSTFDFSIYFSSPPPESTQYIKRAYWYSLDQLNYENAIFLAQLLTTYDSNQKEAKYFLALAHFHLGHHSLVVDILKGCTLSHSLYLLSKSYIQLRNFSASERCLNQLHLLLHNEQNHSIIGDPDAKRITKPDLASCLYLQGLTYRGLGKFEEASLKFKEAIYHNCLIWGAFENLCQISPPNEHYIHSSFSINHMVAKFCVPINQPRASTNNHKTSPDSGISNAGKSNHESSTLSTRSTNKMTSSTPSQTDKISKSSNSTDPSVQMPIANKRVAALSTKTPPSKINSRNTIRSKQIHAPLKSKPTTKILTKAKPTNQKNSNLSRTPMNPTLTPRQPNPTSKTKFNLSPHIDHSNISANCQEPATFETPENVKNHNDTAIKEENNQTKPNLIYPDSTAIEFIHNLFIKLAIGYAQLHNYSSEDAIKTFSSIQCPQFSNPWVQTQISKAYIDLGHNIQAEEVLNESLKKHPLFLDAMDIYSSVLWQLGKTDELYELSNTLTDRHKKLPQTWCAMGNYFNSQHDHTRALKCFKRATLLDNRYALAYNLAGHEYIDIKETQLALQCFQTAVNINPRFYQAWFNIARIYLFSEKYELALAHLAKAISINPRHPILLQYVAECRIRLGHFEDALYTLQLATPMDPNNIMIRYKKAKLLIRLNQIPDAKHELDIIKQNAPEESDVYLTLAKLSTMEGNHCQADLYYQEAIRYNPDLEPRIHRMRELIGKNVPITWDDDQDDF